MAAYDDLLVTIETIHAAGLDRALWPDALAGITRLVGGSAAMLESFDKRAFRHRAYIGFNVPRADEIAYLASQVTVSPRWSRMMPRQRTGDLGWDYQIIDERGMDADPFYGDFLARMDMRYLVAGVLHASAEDYECFSVQRTRDQGHVERREIDLAARLLPHVRHAWEVSRLLAAADEARDLMSSAFDLVSDGTALVRADGSILHTNAAMAAIARRRDGIAIRNGAIDLANGIERARFAAALAAVLRLRDGDATAPVAGEMTVARADGAPPYIVSVRPLPQRERSEIGGAAAMVLVHDPLGAHDAAAASLRELFGLTQAEASVAQALRSGVTPAAYAQTHRLSLNTVYTHLRRVREKTGCTRLAQLIRKLDELHPPLRSA
jgi:DNA-binding CsgD family transcriptional regulator